MIPIGRIPRVCRREGRWSEPVPGWYVTYDGPVYVEPERWALLVDFQGDLPPSLVPSKSALQAAYDGKTVPPEWQPLYDELQRKMRLPEVWSQRMGWPARQPMSTIWEFNALAANDPASDDWIRMVAFLGCGEPNDPLFVWTWRTRLLARWCKIKCAVLNKVAPGKGME